VVELQNEGFEVVIVDDLSNTSLKVLDGIDAITGKMAFEFTDRTKYKIFQNNDISGVIHFAASKAVGESVENPLLYYENNVSALVYVLQELQKMTEANYFSSSLLFLVKPKKCRLLKMHRFKNDVSYGNTNKLEKS
jgi:UDP-glucose 4-epimerase